MVASAATAGGCATTLAQPSTASASFYVISYSSAKSSASDAKKPPAALLSSSKEFLISISFAQDQQLGLICEKDTWIEDEQMKMNQEIQSTQEECKQIDPDLSAKQIAQLQFLCDTQDQQQSKLSR